MREPLLAQIFLQRFLHHDLISPQADRREVLTIVCGTLFSLSLFLAVLLAVKYQFNMFLPPGLTAIFALDDRFLLVTASMLVTALLAVAEWDALSLDARDTAVLGVLPIPRAGIVRAKLYAAGLLAAGCALAWTVAPTLLRAAALPVKLPVTLVGVLRLMLAHAVTSLAAGAFGFLAVVGLRETLRAVLGPAWFERISAGIQAVLVVAFTTALLLLPGWYGEVARGWLSHGRVTPFAVPPLWFVGLHESIAGSVVDALPRGVPARFFAVAEREATEQYRSLWPLFHQLGWVAVLSLVGVALVAMVALAWNSRRLPMPIVARAKEERALRRLAMWPITHLIARQPIAQAGFFFTVQTLFRCVSHRIALATSLAIGLSLVFVTTRAPSSTATTVVRSMPLAALAAQTILLAAILVGFRHAVRVPAELRANWVFQLAWAGEVRPYLFGVKRAGWMTLVLPTLCGLFVWHAWAFGWRFAALHLGVGIVVAMLTMDLAFLGCRRLPFASPYQPSSNLTAMSVVLVVTLLGVAFTLAWIERSVLGTPTGYGALLAALLGAFGCVRAIAAASQRSTAPVDFDEAPTWPTQRIDLIG
jgi:hypothetical protein